MELNGKEITMVNICSACQPLKNKIIEFSNKVMLTREDSELLGEMKYNFSVICNDNEKEYCEKEHNITWD